LQFDFPLEIAHHHDAAQYCASQKSIESSSSKLNALPNEQQQQKSPRNWLQNQFE